MIIPKKYRNHHHINKEKNIGTVYYITIKWHNRKEVWTWGLNPQYLQQTWIFYKHCSGGPISYYNSHNYVKLDDKYM